MALQFNNAITDRVVIGSDATLDNITSGAILMWIYVDSYISARRFYQKAGTAGTRKDLFFFTAGGGDVFNLFWARGVADLKVQGLLANYAHYGAGKWLFLVTLFDIAGANGDQIILIGDLSNVAAEPSAYTQQQVGSGAMGDDSASDASIGDIAGGNLSFDGKIATFQLISGRAVSIAEAISLQWHPRVVANTVAFYHLGYNGVGTQPDWSGNGNAGTVTGATVADHVPLGPPFGFDVVEPYVVVAPVGIVILRRRREGY